MNCWICQSVKSGVGGSNDAPNCHSCVHHRGSNIGNNPLAKVSTDSATYKNFRTNLTFCETKVSARQFGLRWRHPFCTMWHAGASLLKNCCWSLRIPCDERGMWLDWIYLWKTMNIHMCYFFQENLSTYFYFLLFLIFPSGIRKQGTQGKEGKDTSSVHHPFSLVQRAVPALRVSPWRFRAVCAVLGALIIPTQNVRQNLPATGVN